MMEVGMPEWACVPRAHQPAAIEQVVDAFTRVNLVVLDAPVGSGKTYVAERVRRAVNPDRRSIYMCTDKSLQDQVERDFPYARVLKGRANYETQAFPEQWPSISCDDCMLPNPKNLCVYCDRDSCPYLNARERTFGKNGIGGGPLSVVNTAIFLRLGAFKPVSKLVIVDECDQMEQAIIGYVSYEVPRWALRACSMSPPKKASRKTTIVKWLGLLTARLREHLQQLEDPKRRREVTQFIERTMKVASYITRDMTANGDNEEGGGWFRDYRNTQTFMMRPVHVGGYGKEHLWRYGKKWLLMSGTVVNAEDLVESLGWTDEYEVVSVPNTFPVENRQVNIAPVANMTYATTQAETPKLIYAIRELLDIYPRERVLIHTVNYNLTRAIAEGLAGLDRGVYHHQTAAEKKSAMNDWQGDARGVMVSPSMMRGVDLAGDKCRLNIIAKCPFPNLGDRQVSLRLRLAGGQRWYTVRTVRDIQQMVGRSTRSAEDWSATWILDQQFAKTYRENAALFLPSFTDSVNRDMDIRWLMMGQGDNTRRV